MNRTPEAYIRRQERRRRHGEVIPPICHRLTLAPYKVTTPYGIRGDHWSLGRHTGADYAAPIGALVNSVSWGKVIGLDTWGEAYGRHVVIRLGNGSLDCGYMHLSRVLVSVGDPVRPGQTIGHAGATGNVTGPHLHFEVRPRGGRFGSDVAPINAQRIGGR